MKITKRVTILCFMAFSLLLTTGCSSKKEKNDGWNNTDVFKKESSSKYKKNTRQIK